MAFAEGLLGAFQGLAEGVGGHAKSLQDQQIKEEEDKRKFQRELIKGIALQSLEPKSKGFDFSVFGEELVDPEFMRKIAEGMKPGPQSFRPAAPPGNLKPLGPVTLNPGNTSSGNTKRVFK